MSPMTRFVSRKVLAALLAFAVFAIALVGVSFALHGPSAVGLSSSEATDALGAALADPADDPADPAAEPSSEPSSELRAELRADLRAARALEGSERVAALKAIKAKALAGDYGSWVERRAERRDVRHDLLFSLLPDDLQADITAMKAAPADQRKQLRADIMDKAFAGDYGSEVQKAAERLQALRDS